VLDRLTGLEVFGKVTETGSFSAAGRALGLSQTMVTKHIAALETRLGVTLFHRTTRKLSLTEAGRRYLEASGRILADMEAADAAVAADRFEPRGVLRLNAPVAFGVRQIAPLLFEFEQRHPLVSVDLGLNDRTVDLDMTLTTPNCPAAAELPTMVENAVASVPGVGVVNVNIVWEPPWTPERMSDEARLVLNMW